MKRIISEMMLSLVFTSMVTLAFNIQTVKTVPTTITVPDDYSTIQEAINHADEGDTIFVKNNTYYENILVNKTVSLVGENKYATIIDGNSSGKVIKITANNVDVTGFTIRNSGGFPNSTVYCDVGTINNNVISNIITGSGIGIVLNSSTQCSLLENELRNYYGICFYSSSINTISDNNITENSWGIRFENSVNNTISTNNIKDNGSGGIWLESGSNNNNVSNNIIEESMKGIAVWGASSFNIICDNSIIANDFAGIQLQTSDSNTISRNNITKNGKGVYIDRCQSNKIYHNSFLNNNKSAEVLGEYVNTWDDGYPSGGNYWDYYTGVDLYNGQYQNNKGSDGIGDTAYVHNITDHYPLMKPYVGQHDIGITSITISKTVIGLGYNLNVTIKMLNYRIVTENFNLTAYANTTVIDTHSITLTGRNSTSITFTWNNIDFLKGNYTISAYAWPVSGETDTADNTCVDGFVTVTIRGDVDGDFDVDIYDVVKITNIYGFKVGEPDFSPNSDLDDDGEITIYDVVRCTSHYGDIDP